MEEFNDVFELIKYLLINYGFRTKIETNYKDSMYIILWTRIIIDNPKYDCNGSRKMVVSVDKMITNMNQYSSNDIYEVLCSLTYELQKKLEEI